MCSDSSSAFPLKVSRRIRMLPPERLLRSRIRLRSFARFSAVYRWPAPVLVILHDTSESVCTEELAIAGAICSMPVFPICVKLRSRRYRPPLRKMEEMAADEDAEISLCERMREIRI